jgi:hypothetical protein
VYEVGKVEWGLKLGSIPWTSGIERIVSALSLVIGVLKWLGGGAAVTCIDGFNINKDGVELEAVMVRGGGGC